MPRIRTIKPEFFSNEELSHCTPHARLLAIALLQLADSEGRMRWIPSQIIAHAFPWEAVDLSPMIHQLCTVKYLELYTVNGREYACIPAFNKHQRLSGKEAACKSKFPHIDQADTEGKTDCFTGKHLDAQEQGNKGTREQVERGNKPKAAKRGSRLTEKAMPQEWLFWAMSEKPELNMTETFAKFYDYWIAQPGQKGVKLDWFATWRNWVRRENERGNNSGSHQQAPKQSLAARADEGLKRAQAIHGNPDDGKLVGEDDTPVRP